MRPALPSAFTSSRGRRAVLEGLAAAPLLALWAPAAARAADYASAADVFAAIEAGEAAGAERLRALPGALPPARPVASSRPPGPPRHTAPPARHRARLRP